jgi:hypothetical protein
MGVVLFLGNIECSKSGRHVDLPSSILSFARECQMFLIVAYFLLALGEHCLFKRYENELNVLLTVHHSISV